jgi:hypothetical protein
MNASRGWILLDGSEMDVVRPNAAAVRNHLVLWRGTFLRSVKSRCLSETLWMRERVHSEKWTASLICHYCWRTSLLRHLKHIPSKATCATAINSIAQGRWMIGGILGDFARLSSRRSHRNYVDEWTARGDLPRESFDEDVAALNCWLNPSQRPLL